MLAMITTGSLALKFILDSLPVTIFQQSDQWSVPCQILLDVVFVSKHTFTSSPLQGSWFLSHVPIHQLNKREFPWDSI
jgi:hypothetical protein